MKTWKDRVRWLAGSPLAPGGFILISSLLLSSCGRDSSPNRPASGETRLADDCVARVGNIVISREDFEREWGRRGHRPDKQALLDEMIRSAAILAQARAAGYDRDPEVAARLNQFLVTRFQEEQLSKRAAAATPVNEADVETFYRGNQERFTTPETLRAAVICVKCSPRATGEKRAELANKAGSLRAEAGRCDARGFTRLAGQHSDDQATRYVGGDTGWLQRGESTHRWPAAVVAAAWSLPNPGDIAPLVAMADGFYIVRLTERKPALVRPLDEVRDAIRYQLDQEQKHRQERDFVEEMKRGLIIDLNSPLLESISSRAQAREQQPPSLPGS